jgi:hypothetical protein
MWIMVEPIAEIPFRIRQSPTRCYGCNTLLDINKRKQEKSSRTITRYDIVGIHCVMFICYFC